MNIRNLIINNALKMNIIKKTFLYISVLHRTKKSPCGDYFGAPGRNRTYI